MAEIVQLTAEQEAEFNLQTSASEKSALLKKPSVALPDGNIATVHSIGVGDEQGEWVIPTIVGGKKISDDEAIQLWKSGTNKPIGGPFKTPEEATKYAQAFHGAEEKRISNAVSLTPAQEADFRRQTGTIDPILDFSPEQIAELAKQDTEGFDLVSAFQQNRKLYSDPAIAQKAADALDLIESQTSVIDSAVDLAKHPVKTAGKAIGATIDIGKNMGRIAWRMLTEAPTAVGAAIGERLDRWAGVDPAKTTAVRQEAQRKVAEAWAGIESSTAGLGMQIARAPGKIQQMAGKKRSPEEKLDHLFKRAGEVEQIQLATAGKGEFMKRVGGDILRELEAAGKPVDPVVASELASGDPFVWWAFGKAFHGVGKATPKIARQASAALGADLGDIAVQAGGRTLQGLGTATKAVATGAGTLAGAAPAAGLVGGLVQGGPVGALAGLKGGELASRAIKRGTGLVEKAGAKAAEVGKQIADVTPLTFPVAQVARDVLQTLPAASGMVAKGAALDVGLAALTSETPAEMEHMISVGTALGAVGAGRRVAGRVISGQLIAPRPWGSKTPVASSGQFPTLDTLHSNSIRDAGPGITARLNAVRQFLSGAAPGTDLFFGKDSASIEKALLDSGVDPATAKTFSEQEGFFTAQLPGRDGTPKPVIIVKNIDAAPHEAFHPFQDVIGEGANRSIDEVMRRVYADQWESLGQSYANRLVGQEGNWRDTILNASGWGRAEAIEKIVNQIEKQYADQTGSPPPEGLAEHEAAETWKRALSEVRQANPDAPMGDLQREAWRGILTEAEATAVADRYLARELAAENFDAAFKNLGPELQNTSGIIPWFARIAAKTTALLGGEPLAGRESAYGVPLSAEAVQAVTGAARPTVERTSPATPVVTARRAPASVPATPEARTQAATDAQSISDAAPTAPVAGGTRSPRELLGDIAAAIAQQVGVKINYLSALDEPAAAISSNRAARREMIELFRSMPQSARALWEKTFFPERLIQTGAGIQVFGWAPEVFAANAHKITKSVGDKSALLPYPVDPKTGTFTDAGWQELFRDTQTFVRNQLSGRTGAGEGLVVPADLQNRGFYKPPVTGSAAPLDQRKADFINLLFGVPLPKTPRITKGKLPLNIAGQDVSVATKPGRVSVPVEPRAKFGEGSEKAREAAEQLGITGREILEVNPLRAELEAAGVKLPGLIEAVQRLDANNIKEVQLAPEQPQFRGNTLTLSAGFQPKAENPRAVKEAAVRDEGGKIFTGRWHGEAEEAALQFYDKRGFTPELDQDGNPTNLEAGFVTNSGEFLSREGAFRRAEELSQITKAAANEMRTANIENRLESAELESHEFNEARQFQPPREDRSDEREMPMAPGQRLIEVLGPDGTVYKARFDGYQEVPGRAPVAQITPVEGFPWQGDSKRSTTYETTIVKRGFKVPELPTPEQWESERVETGFTQFQPKKFSETQEFTTERTKNLVSRGILKRDPGVSPTADPSGQAWISPEGDVFSGASFGHGHESWAMDYIVGGLVDAITPGFEGLRDFVATGIAKQRGWIPIWIDNTSRAELGIYVEGSPNKIQKEIIESLAFSKKLPVLKRSNDKLLIESTEEFLGRRQFQPNREVQKVADEYAGRPLPHGIKPPVINDELARKLAEFYESEEHAPTDEAVRASYDALRDETLQQLSTIEAAGYTIEPWTGKGEPYKSSADMAIDVNQNKHLYFKQTGTEVQPDNLMAEFNDIFRAVHDFFGHAAEGYQFGPRGELAAWNAHSEMYSPAAQGALAAETLAQNSWVNFGKHLEGKNIPLPDRPFAEQKNIVVPKELIAEAKKQFESDEPADWPAARAAREKGRKERMDAFLGKAPPLLPSQEFPSEAFKKSTGQFQPKRKADESLKFAGTQFNEPSKAWILPDGTVEQLGAQWHHAWLDENPAVQKKYGLKVPPFEGGDTEGVREAALKRGFARLNLDNGVLTVEARERDWKRLRPKIEDMIEQNIDDVDRFRVSLLNESINKVTKSFSEKIFDLDSDKEKMDKVFGTFAEQPQGEIGVQFQPRRAEQEQLFGGRELLSSVELGKMTKAEIADHFPEAVIPSKRDEKIPSEITKSPLYKRAADEASAVSAFADKLAEFANQYKDDPLFKSGSRWYSEFTPMLKREFGADAQLMAELLAATSPQTPPSTNFGYAFDALEGFRSGRFRKTIDKFNQGLDMLSEDRWLSWYNKELKAGRIPEPPAEPTAAAFLEHWIATHDLKPRQSNGKLYGQHSLPVLQVFVRRWLELNKGLKTRNFVENLTGESHEATIDLWADRTMRRLGYEGRARWRILPQNGTGVSDADFSFAQKAFRAAADKLGMKPDDLQGALWFAEKSLWADNGWGRIDLGDFRKEMEKLPLLRAGVRHRLERTAAAGKTAGSEETELLVEPRKLK